MSEKLKPCPFCGSKDIVHKEIGDYHHPKPVQCQDCTAMTDTVKEWNNRADGWISVAERLPEDCTWVLITTDIAGKRDTTMSFYEDHDGENYWCRYLDDEEGWDKVTHWQPLPPPKAD